MGVISTALRHFMAAGLTGDALISAIADLESASATERPSKANVPRKIVYTPEFEAFWKAYPTDQNMSKLEAFQVWQKMPVEERELAVTALPPFKTWLKAQPADYRCVHACRFLSKKRYEGHAQGGLQLVIDNNRVYITKDMPEWGKYAEAYRAQKGCYPPTDKRDGWFFEKEAL